MLKVIRREKCSCLKNMKFDEKLLNNLNQGPMLQDPILHFYDWEKRSLTYGFFIKPEEFLDIAKIKMLDIDIAKRPTGGGIIFHIWDMAFSFLMPKSNKFFYLNPLENYQFVNKIVLNAILKSFNLDESEISFLGKKEKTTVKSFFCMATPSKYDLLYKEKKIVGASQRRKKNGYLHQGTISLLFPSKKILKEIVKKKEFLELMLINTYPLLKEEKEKVVIENKKRELQNNLINCFKKTLF